MGEIESVIYLETNIPPAMNLWNQTCYTLSKMYWFSRHKIGISIPKEKTEKKKEMAGIKQLQKQGGSPKPHEI
jgi:hypothetical protein